MRRYRRALRACAILVIGAVATLGSTSCGGATDTRIAGYCAILPDAIGLYAGNPVTQMGYPIGKINKVTPSDMSVRVDFSVVENRPLPSEVKAVVRSTSILADRALELVGDYDSGPKLRPGQCIPLGRSATPKSISEVIGSTNNFIKGINPQNSTNVKDAVRLLDQAFHNNGAGINQILTTSSRMLDSPDQAISDLRTITFNLATLTQGLVDMRGPLKEILNDAVITTPELHDALAGAKGILTPLWPVITMLSDLEIHAGDEIQLTLDAVADVVRINSPHWPGWLSVFGGILKSAPWWINAVANHYNNMPYFSLFYRPPLYHIRTPNGPMVCAMMNGSNPGSCANVAGQPYGVDINLLQYVFMEANR